VQPKAGPLPTWLPGGLYVCFFCDLFLSSFLCAHWSSYFFPFADGMVKAQLAHTGRCFILREVWVGPTPCFAVKVNACGLEYIRFQIRDIVVHRSLGHHCSMLALLGFLQNQILCGLRSIFASQFPTFLCAHHVTPHRRARAAAAPQTAQPHPGDTTVIWR